MGLHAPRQGCTEQHAPGEGGKLSLGLLCAVLSHDHGVGIPILLNICFMESSQSVHAMRANDVVL